MSKSILVSLAHPDDEVGLGGLIARSVAEGTRATLICATNGDVGTVDEKFLREYDSIPELRLAELKCATQTIGFTEVVTFGYRDSGMMGSADNEHPQSLWQAPLAEVTERVVEVMRNVRPQIVITFNTFGAYGHPDHIKINQATIAAYQQLQSEPEHPQKLYYMTFPKIFINFFLWLIKLRGQDPTKMGRNKDMDFTAVAKAITPATSKIPVGKYRSVSFAAQDCYPSQIEQSGFARFMQRRVGLLLPATEMLSRVYPEPRPGEPIERDLFENVVI